MLAQAILKNLSDVNDCLTNLIFFDSKMNTNVPQKCCGTGIAALVISIILLIVVIIGVCCYMRNINKYEQLNPDKVDDPNYWINKQKLATPLMKPQNNYYSTSVYSMDEAVAPTGLGATNTANLRTGPYSNNTNNIEVQPNGEVVESVLTQPLKQLENIGLAEPAQKTPLINYNNEATINQL